MKKWNKELIFFGFIPMKTAEKIFEN